MTETSLSILNKTKSKLPRLPFVSMKDEALGKEYELSLVFITQSESHKLNLLHRKKDKPTDILSFPLDQTSGEIFIDLTTAKKEALKFERPFTNFIGFLFIHGLIHLKGFEHGSTMESEERKIRKMFGI